MCRCAYSLQRDPTPEWKSKWALPARLERAASLDPMLDDKLGDSPSTGADSFLSVLGYPPDD